MFIYSKFNYIFILFYFH